MSNDSSVKLAAGNTGKNTSFSSDGLWRSPLWLHVAAVLIAFISLSLGSTAAWSVPHRPKVKPQGLGSYIRSGVVVGGYAGEALSLLRMQKMLAPDGAERLVILYGDKNGNVVKSELGYFHISVDERNSRVSIDLAQVQRTAVDAKDLAKVFNNSRLVSTTEMTMDPLDLSTNISLTLQQPAEIKVNVETSQGTKRLIIDMRPLKGAGAFGKAPLAPPPGSARELPPIVAKPSVLPGEVKADSVGVVATGVKEERIEKSVKTDKIDKTDSIDKTDKTGQMDSNRNTDHLDRMDQTSQKARKE